MLQQSSIAHLALPADAPDAHRACMYLCMAHRAKHSSYRVLATMSLRKHDPQERRRLSTCHLMRNTTGIPRSGQTSCPTPRGKGLPMCEKEKVACERRETGDGNESREGRGEDEEVKCGRTCGAGWGQERRSPPRYPQGWSRTAVQQDRH